MELSKSYNKILGTNPSSNTGFFSGGALPDLEYLKKSSMSLADAESERRRREKQEELRTEYGLRGKLAGTESGLRMKEMGTEYGLKGKLAGTESGLRKQEGAFSYGLENMKLPYSSSSVKSGYGPALKMR